MKRILFLLTVLLLSSALSAHDFESNGIYYNITSSNTVEVTFFGNSIGAYKVDSLTVPSTVLNGTSLYTVNRIGNGAFAGSFKLVHVSLPDEIEQIGESAFLFCESLEKIVLPPSITSIEKSTFLGCESLSEINLHEGILKIDDEAFSDCTSLQDLVLPKSLIYIGSGVFMSSGIRSIIIPEGVTVISDQTFSNCSSLISVSVPSTLKKVGKSAFKGSSITVIELPMSTTEIDDNAFSECSSLSQVIIANENALLGHDILSQTLWFANQPVGLVYIGNTALTYKGIAPTGTILTVRAGTTAIAPDCFSRQNGIVSVTLPEEILEIGERAFFECKRLQSVAIPNAVSVLNPSLFEGCDSLRTISISPACERIERSVFKNCIRLTAINLPATLTFIGASAFEACQSLSTIAIPEAIGELSDSIFAYCVGLQSIQLPSRLSAIGECAFSRCDKLKTIDLPASLRTMGNRAFYTSGLEELFLPPLIDSLSEFVFTYSPLRSIDLGTNLRYIGNSAFANCKSIDTIVIPNSVVTIGPSAFENTYLKSVELGNSVELIGRYAFMSCFINNISIPKSVKQIGTKAFFQTKIEQITCESPSPPAIIDSVSYIWTSIEGNKLIDHSTFSNYNAILRVPMGSRQAYLATPWKKFIVRDGEDFMMDGIYYTTTSDSTVSVIFQGARYNTIPEYYGDIVIPEYVTYEGISYAVTRIENDAFRSNPYLTSISIPNNVKAIGENAFFDCTGLETINLGDGVKSIGMMAFVNNTKLKQINWGSSIEMIGDAAFASCSMLDTLRLPNSLKYIGSNVFASCSGLNTVVLPDSTSYINKMAFMFSAVRNIEIGENTLLIGEYAFLKCPLDTIVCNALIPPYCDTSSFSSVSKNIPVIVPEQSVALYKTANVWKEFDIIAKKYAARRFSATSCGAYLFGGRLLDKSGIYTDTLRGNFETDSIVQLQFTMFQISTVSATKSVAFGQTYQFGTQLLDKSGNYTEKFQSANGCDSTVTLAFTVLPNSAPHITMSVKTFRLAENSANGTTLATFTAEDSEGAALVYSISGSAAFTIDPATGAVTVKDSSLLDYETAKSLTFTVRVSDGTAYDEVEITVTLTDVVETGLAMNAESVIIFPNTFSDRLSISATAYSGTLLVTAQNGAEVYSAKFGGYTDINTRNWPAGKYTVSIVSGKQVYSETIIKE